MICRRSAAASVALALGILGLLTAPATAQTVVKIGLINSYTGFIAQAADQGRNVGGCAAHLKRER